MILTLVVLVLTAGEPFSALTGLRAAEDQHVFHLQAGWPGVSATFLSGGAGRADLGGRVSFNAALGPLLAPGVLGQVLWRLRLFEGELWHVSLVAAPGVLVHFQREGVVFGLAASLGVNVGLTLRDGLRLVLLAEVPLTLQFTPRPPTGSRLLSVPVLGGAGIELRASDRVSITLQARAGPAFESESVRASQTGPETTLSSTRLEAQVLSGIAFAL